MDPAADVFITQFLMLSSCAQTELNELVRKCMEWPSPVHRAHSSATFHAPGPILEPRSASGGRPQMNPQSFAKKFRDSGRYVPYGDRCPVPRPAAGQNIVAPAAAAEDDSDWEWEHSVDYTNGWPRNFKRKGPRYPYA